jgi:hypothetical protein
MLQYILSILSDVMCTFSRYDYTWLFAISFNKVDKHLENWFRKSFISFMYKVTSHITNLRRIDLKKIQSTHLSTDNTDMCN